MRTHRLFALATILFTLCLAAPARAALHLFTVAEAFSSADGSVQFIRLHCNFSSQNFFNGSFISCTSGATVHTLNFDHNLDTNLSTANSDVLIATANFAALSGVTPDFIIPADFIIRTGGTINFGGFNSMVYGPLPTNGQHSLTPGNVQMVNMPRNFARVSGSVNVPPGSCCVATTCSVAVAVSCTGTFSLGGTCNPNPCVPTTGACCRGSTCAVTTQAACTGAFNAFTSAGAACNPAAGPGTNTSPCCKADFNHIGGASVQDIFDFLNTWLASSPIADFNGGGLDVQDIFDFINAWLAGC